MPLNIKQIQKTKPISDLLNFSIINLDKPTGPTSFSVSQFIKKSLSLPKTSHFGTLDPQVTGILPVALNRACRLNEYLMHRDKTYVGIMCLHAEVSTSKLKEEIKNFIGKIIQLPPVRSRVKRAPRQREVKTFKILEIQGKNVLFETQVQAGTYIRKLCHDLGEKIGGAHMLELRRVQAGLFSEESIINLYDFESALEKHKVGDSTILRSYLTPGEIVTTLLSTFQILPDFEKKALTGSPIFPSSLLKSINLKKDTKACALINDKFIGVYNIINSEEIFAKAEFVLN
jgi:H/ACA ribonucleoprotein complex subunit 4